jgi:hypothetical protein
MRLLVQLSSFCPTPQLSRPGGGFIIAPEPILDHDQTDMEQSLSTMSGDLQKMALKMADDSGLEGSGKRKRHSGLLTEELQAMRERSMSVQVRLLCFVSMMLTLVRDEALQALRRMLVLGRCRQICAASHAACA